MQIHVNDKWTPFKTMLSEISTTILSPWIQNILQASQTSICIFFIQLPRHFVAFWQGEFVQQSRASLVGDHLLYSYDLSIWFRGDIVRRN